MPTLHLSLTHDVRTRILSEARRALPRECVGLVVGPRVGMGDGITPLQNRALDDDAFAVDPVEHATTRRAIRAEGRVVVALYHSHPHGHATLSRRDQAFLVVDGAPLFPDEWAIVVAPSADAEVALRAFTWAVGGFQECPIAWISGGAPIGTSRSA